MSKVEPETDGSGSGTPASDVSVEAPADVSEREKIDRQCRLAQLTALVLFIGYGAANSANSSGLFRKICEVTAEDMYPHQQTDCSKNISDSLNVAVVKENTKMNIYINLASSIIPCLVSLILSAWGDRVGRKSNIMIGMTGVQILILVQIIYVSMARPPYYLIPIVSVFLGFTGLHIIVATSVVQYVADIETNRAMMVVRCMICSAATKIGQVIGNAIASAILKHRSFGVAMFVGQIIVVIGIGMTLAFIEQKPPRTARKKLQTDENTPKTSARAKTVELLKEIGRTYTKPRPGGRRFVFWAILASLAFASTGETSFAPIYLQSKPLRFQPYQLSIYQAVNGVVIAVGSTMLSIASVFLKIADLPLACISLTSHFFSRFPIALADKQWEVYLSPVIGCCGYLFYGSYQAAIAKLMAPEECGKGLAGEALGTTLASVFGDIILNEVYNQTVSIYRATAWFVSAALILLAFAAGCVAFFRGRDIPELKFINHWAERRKAREAKKNAKEAAQTSDDDKA